MSGNWGVFGQLPSGVLCGAGEHAATRSEDLTPYGQGVDPCVLYFLWSDI
jgi:hypothetical protein